MNTLLFLTEWTLRSSALILAGALLLRVLRVKDSSIRLAAWTAMLCGSLALPLLTKAVPEVPVAVSRTVATPRADLRIAPDDSPIQLQAAPIRQASNPSFEASNALVLLYGVVAAGLLLRLAIGLVITHRLRHRSYSTNHETDGVEIRESAEITTPVALGVLRPVIVVPVDWRQWDSAKLEAVLAHERSHILRNDPAVQVLAMVHRALLWFSPLSWYLHRQIVQLAEEASDDAAVAITLDRATYAEILLDFMRRGVRGQSWQGVSMAARYGRPDQRIHRILDSSVLSAGVTRSTIAAILTLGLPLAIVAAALSPQSASPVRIVLSAAPAFTPAPAAAPAPPRLAAASFAPSPVAVPEPAQSQPRETARIRRYAIFNGTSRSGSWDSDDDINEAELRSKFGDKFAWFRQAGKEYVTTDSGVLKEFDAAMAPQRSVNEKQNEVNGVQSTVNELQSKVNSLQNEVNALQNAVNRRQDIANRIQASMNNGNREEQIRKLEEALKELRNDKGEGSQEAVNKKQAEVNEAQGRVNQRQHEVNERQAKVNEEQRRVNADFNKRIQEIFATAILRGLTRPIN